MAHMVGWIAQSTHSTAVVGGLVFELAEEVEKVGPVERVKRWVSVWWNQIVRKDSGGWVSVYSGAKGGLSTNPKRKSFLLSISSFDITRRRSSLHSLPERFTLTFSSIAVTGESILKWAWSNWSGLL